MMKVFYRDFVSALYPRQLPQWVKWVLLPLTLPIFFLVLITFILLVISRWIGESLIERMEQEPADTAQIYKDQCSPEEQEEEFVLPHNLPEEDYRKDYPIAKFTSEGGLKNGVWEGYKTEHGEDGKEKEDDWDDPRYL